MSRWSADILIPSSLWLGLFLASAVLLVWYARRRPSVVPLARWWAMLALMGLAIVLVLLLLLNPTSVRQIPPPAGRPLLTVLVDASASMNTPDAGGESRYEAAARATAQMSDRLSDRFNLRVRTFAGAVTASDVEHLAAGKPAGRTTDISAAITACLDEERSQGQAIVLLSDGAHNAGTIAGVLNASRLARAMGAPIYTRTYGGDASGLDLGIELRSAQDLAFIGQKTLVTARVSHVGLAGTHPDVVLLQDGKEIARQKADILGDEAAEVHFWISQEKAGVYPYELRIPPLPGELTAANNAALYMLRVVDEPIHILQIEGKPYWDSKFLLRTLTDVPAVELDSAVRVADGRIMWRTIGRGETAPASQSTTQAVPASSPVQTSPPSIVRSEKWKIVTDPGAVLGSAEAIKNYQIIVLGRDAEPFLGDAAVANLQNWVARGGGSLICYRGSPTSQNNERLARLLPVKWTPTPEARFRVQMTVAGRDLHWLTDIDSGAAVDDNLPRMPTLARAAEPQRSKPLAVVLANSVSSAGETLPAVIYQNYGIGRVVVIEGTGMWRWAFLPPEYQKQEEVYGTLWHSMLRWLVSGSGLPAGQNQMLRAQKLTFGADEPAGVVLLVREETLKGAPPAILLSPEASGAASTFAPVAVADQPGVFRVDFGKLPEGRYRASVAGAPADDSFAKAVFDVRRFGEEELNIKARPVVMQRVAEESGGAVLGADLVAELQAKFSEHLAHAHPPRVERTTAWDRWWVLMLVLGAWTGSWWLRRSGGLV